MADTTITYEITTTVQEDIREEYEHYMINRHIPDLLATGLFASATISTSLPGRYRVRYEAHNRESLNHYLREHAQRLRQDFTEHFPKGVEISREEWETIAVLTANIS